MYQEPGRTLDKLIAIHVFDFTPCGCSNPYCDLYEPPVGSPLADPDGNITPIPHFSTDIADCKKILDKLAPLVGDYRYGDGWFLLNYAEWATHKSVYRSKDCDFSDEYAVIGEEADNDDVQNDPFPWSAHFHFGLLGSFGSEQYLRHWQHGAMFCAIGRTAEHAICLAALKVMGVQ